MVLLLLGAVGLGICEAKDYLIVSWQFDDDLPRDGINSITQGKDGYLWVSSRFGLARTDGARFTDFTAKVGAQFLGYHYANLTTDNSGAVWISTPGGGLLRWRDQQLEMCAKAGNPVFGPVVAGLTNSAGDSVAVTPDGRVVGWDRSSRVGDGRSGVVVALVDASRWGEPVPHSICQGKEGTVWWITYQHKLVRVSGTNAEELVWGSGNEQRNWIALQTDAAGELWAGTQRDLGVWRDGKFELIQLPMEPFPVDDLVAIPRAPGQGSVPSEKPEAGVRDPQSPIRQAEHRLWVVALGQAWLLEDGRWTTNVLFEPTAGLYETTPRMADKEGNLWFTGTKGGIFQASSDGTLTPLTEKDGVAPGRLAALYQDREGSTWAGIEHAGLARLTERFFRPIGLSDGTKAPLVWAVAEDASGAIWLGTEHNGLQRWQENKLTRFDFGNGSLPGSVYSLCRDREGAVWAGTGDRGVFRFENGKFAPVWENPERGWNKRVYVIHQDRRGRMWFGTGLGLFCWEEEKARQYLAKGFDMGVVRAMTEDAAGRLWLGLSQGSKERLACVEGDDVVAKGTEAGLRGYDIYGLTMDADGTLWIGTVGGGLWGFENGVFSHYGAPEGLPDERIYSIAEDRRNNLWLGTPVGIIRVEKESINAVNERRASRLRCLVYNRTDGLPTRECSGGAQPSVWRERDGRLLFAMTEGAIALSPDAVKMNEVPPAVLIEQLTVDGKEMSLGGAIALPPGRHVLEFQYTATTLMSPSKVRFKCRLEGVDKDWREPSPARSEMYSITAPGRYRFSVSACNNDGVWNDSGTALAFTVAPYFWQTWLAKGSGACLAALAIAGTIRFVERKKARRRIEYLERQQLIQNERARIARDIHDELGASLTEIGLLSEFARRDEAGADQVKADIEKIASKAQSSTRALDQIVWAVNPRNDTVEGFATYACAWAQEQLRLAGIRCRLEAPASLPGDALPADVRHHLFMAFKEALNNALKHARASQVDIAIKIEGGVLSVLISDNGCGFAYDPADTKISASNGLTGMRERLQTIGGEFECDSKPGGGTRVRLTVTYKERI